MEVEGLVRPTILEDFPSFYILLEKGYQEKGTSDNASYFTGLLKYFAENRPRVNGTIIGRCTPNSVGTIVGYLQNAEIKESFPASSYMIYIGAGGIIFISSLGPKVTLLSVF